MNTVPQQPGSSNKPLAAIWARKSTEGQNEASLETQVALSRQLLEREGYTPTFIFQDTWSSLDLTHSPKYQQLVQLAHDREVAAIAVYDRDRLPAAGKDRMGFLWDMAEYGVKVLSVYGPPIQESPEGQAIELLLAAGKERQVRRARQGSKDGLRFRVVNKRKPIARHPLFGYARSKDDWHEVDGHYRLIPNEDHSTVKIIFNMLLEGKGYDTVIKELERHGTRSPANQTTWNKTTLSQMVRNPAYTGRYYALKKQMVEPTNRRGSTTGNTSNRAIPLDQQVYLPEVEIVDPPITWAEREKIARQVEQHQKYATRNAKKYYLLRGMIYCATHRGKNGEPRRYHGRPHRGRWMYCCPGGIGDVNIDGPNFEMYWTAILGFKTLSLSDDLLAGSVEQQEGVRLPIERELADLKRRVQKRVDKVVRLEDDRLGGRYDNDREAYDRLKARYENERIWIESRQNELLGQMTELSRRDEARETIAQLRSRWAGGLFDYFHAMQSMNPNEWPIENLRVLRELFEAVDLRITMCPSDAVNEPDTFTGNFGLGEKVVRFKVSATIELPAPKDVPTIGSSVPGPAQHNRRYPLRLVSPENDGLVTAGGLR